MAANTPGGIKIRRLKPQKPGHFLRAAQQSESFPRVDAAHHPLMRISLLILLRKLPFPSFLSSIWSAKIII
ncbi:hypothetical protein D3C85_371950 [compost metagenome]